MFECGEYVFYGSSGVCRIEEIRMMSMMSGTPEKLYYIMSPLSQKGGKLFAPVENPKTPMRPVMTEAEARNLISQIPQIDVIWVESDKLREEKYKECIKSCDSRDLIRIIKTLHHRKVERTAQGKKITSTDDKYLKLAEDFLYTELEIPLGIPKKEMPGYIASCLGVKEE